MYKQSWKRNDKHFYVVNNFILLGEQKNSKSIEGEDYLRKGGITLVMLQKFYFLQFIVSEQHCAFVL